MPRGPVTSCMAVCAGGVACGYILSNWYHTCWQFSFLCHLLFSLYLGVMVVASPEITFSTHHIEQNHRFIDLSKCCHTEYSCMQRRYGQYGSYLADILYVCFGMSLSGYVSAADCVPSMLLACVACRHRDTLVILVGCLAILCTCAYGNGFSTGSIRMLAAMACMLLAPFCRSLWVCHSVLALLSLFQPAYVDECSWVPAAIPAVWACVMCSARPSFVLMFACLTVLVNVFGFI